MENTALLWIVNSVIWFAGGIFLYREARAVYKHDVPVELKSLFASIYLMMAVSMLFLSCSWIYTSIKKENLSSSCGITTSAPAVENSRTAVPSEESGAGESPFDNILNPKTIWLFALQLCAALGLGIHLGCKLSKKSVRNIDCECDHCDGEEKNTTVYDLIARDKQSLARFLSMNMICDYCPARIKCGKCGAEAEESPVFNSEVCRANIREWLDRPGNEVKNVSDVHSAAAQPVIAVKEKSSNPQQEKENG